MKMPLEHKAGASMTVSAEEVLHQCTCTQQVLQQSVQQKKKKKLQVKAVQSLAC